jgi:hypothetical protein
MTEEHPEERKEQSTVTVHKPDSVVMPANKDYFAFLSHKKKNSKLGSATEGLALRVGDMQVHFIYCRHDRLLLLYRLKTIWILPWVKLSLTWITSRKLRWRH